MPRAKQDWSFSATMAPYLAVTTVVCRFNVDVVPTVKSAWETQASWHQVLHGFAVGTPKGMKPASHGFAGGTPKGSDFAPGKDEVI